jgi:hypothetical protein
VSLTICIEFICFCTSPVSVPMYEKCKFISSTKDPKRKSTLFTSIQSLVLSSLNPTYLAAPFHQRQNSPNPTLRCQKFFYEITVIDERRISYKFIRKNKRNIASFSKTYLCKDTRTEKPRFFFFWLKNLRHPTFEVMKVLIVIYKLQEKLYAHEAEFWRRDEVPRKQTPRRSHPHPFQKSCKNKNLKITKTLEPQPI